MKEIEILAMFSENASKYYKVCEMEVVDLDDYTGYEGGISFHPNGRCGCILMDDESLFGIRCNHLMWADGKCEGIEEFWTDTDHMIANEKMKNNDYSSYNAVLLYGNHKGTLWEKMVIFHEQVNDKE